MPIRLRKRTFRLMIMQNLIKKFFKQNNYVRTGECKQCGKCCRNITFKIKEEFVTSADQFEHLKKWDRKYRNFFISDVDEKGVLLFTCKSLSEDNRCKTYFFRSPYCWSYPKIGSQKVYDGAQTLEGCGYYFTPKKDFRDFLKRD
jgi:Fe-S-cluster containining protein